MGDWMNHGPFGPGPWSDWMQNMFQNVTGGIRGFLGFPRPEMLEAMDDFALKSLKRHLEARRQDLEDMIQAVDQEMNRRARPSAEPEVTKEPPPAP